MKITLEFMGVTLFSNDSKGLQDAARDKQHARLLTVISKAYEDRKTLQRTTEEIRYMIERVVNKYSPKALDTVIKVLKCHKLLSPAFLIEFLVLMDSFDTTDASNFSDILRTFRKHTAPFSLFIPSKEIEVKSLLALKGKGKNLKVLKAILEKTAHTAYPSHNIEQLCSQDVESLQHELHIINLLDTTTLIRQDNLENIFYYPQRASHRCKGHDRVSPAGFQIQYKLLSALKCCTLLTQSNINALQDIKCWAQGKTLQVSPHDLLAMFIPIILEFSKRCVLSQDTLDVIFPAVIDPLKENTQGISHAVIPDSLKFVPFAMMDTCADKQAMLNNFFEGCRCEIGITEADTQQNRLI